MKYILLLVFLFTALSTAVSQPGPESWRQVQLSNNPEEVSALVPLDIISVKATGTTVFSSVTRVNYRAFQKARMAASLIGGEAALLLHQSVEGNLMPLRTARTQTNWRVYARNRPDTAQLRQLAEERATFAVGAVAYLRNNASDIQYSYMKPWEVSIDQCYSIVRGVSYLHIKQPGLSGDYRIVSVDDRQIVSYQIKGTTVRQLVLLRK